MTRRGRWRRSEGGCATSSTSRRSPRTCAQEDRFWNHTLAQVAAHFGEPEAEVDTQVVCVDKKRQWSKWRNVWQSSAIRSTLYMLGAPVRGVKGLFRAKQPVA